MILGFLSFVGIFVLFFRPRPDSTAKIQAPVTPEKLFAQVIQASGPKVLKLWEEGDRIIKSEGLKCDEEILFDSKVGRSYYQCQPHFWQCYWAGEVTKDPALKIEIFGQTYHVRAKASFAPISAYSQKSRFYEILNGPYDSMNFYYGMLAELSVDEIPGMTLPIVLTDTCRDTYLPQRVYGYGQSDFTWDNFDRQIFIDKFYVTNQQVNEWRVLSGELDKVKTDRRTWPHPALLGQNDQSAYCQFWGKRVLEAKLFDAATMTPSDLKDPEARRVLRPDTPWQRDLSKTFLGMSRINPDYQLTPLDCQLAQVQGCSDKYFSTDSVTWMGINYALGFYPEAFVNRIEPKKNLKLSSKFYSPASEVHVLGKLGFWKGEDDSKLPVAFRCYEEVSQ
jgi:hypothetical protein